jgi:hypothetical protein
MIKRRRQVPLYHYTGVMLTGDSGAREFAYIPAGAGSFFVWDTISNMPNLR